LLRIAHYPHDNNTWLGDRYAIISNKEPPRPFAPNTEFSCMLLLLGNKDYTWFELPSGDRGCFYELTPLYTEERNLKKRQGINALVQALDDHQVTWQVDTSRPNVAK
jgi:hypothetical protein